MFDVSCLDHMVAPASEFLKKGVLGKYILVFICPNGQADFQKTKDIFSLCMSQMSRYMQTMQRKIPKYCLSFNGELNLLILNPDFLEIMDVQR